MFFDTWSELGRICIVGVLAYVAVIVFLRVSGNRTLAKMNAFDFIVTVALGSTLATILLSRDVSLAEGLVALAMLIGLQFAITWLSVRLPLVDHLVKSEARLLLFRGRFLPDAMRRARVVEGEILAAVRGHGLASLDDVEAVVLETDGSLSVVRGGDPAAQSSLGDMQPIARSADS